MAGDRVKHAWLLVLLSAACVPDLDVDESLLGTPRLLAVRAEPAEARPGESVTFTGLYAGEDGVIEAAPLDWAFCLARPAPSELSPYAASCVAWESEDLLGFGVGSTASSAVPRDACRRFGPDPPPVGEDGAVGRPIDPDPTGGYRIPLRIIEPDDDAIAMAELRVGCGVAGANQALSAAFRRRYRTNVAPEITVTLRDATGAPLGASAGLGQPITLVAALPACAESDVCGDGLCGIDEELASCPADCGGAFRSGCGGRERYLRYDAASASLVTERESVRLAWHVTSGTLALERNGLSGATAELELGNVWTPTAPGEATLIVVARDDRGAASWVTRTITIE